MSRDIIREAIKDAAAVHEMAVRVAERRIIERLAPDIARTVREGLATSTPEDVDRLRRAADGYGETEFEESVGESKMANKSGDTVREAIRAMFPGLNERGLPADEPVDEMGGIPALDDEQKDEAAMPVAETFEEPADESVELSAEEMQRAYENIMRLDASMNEASVDWSPDVSKGFKDSYPASEWETEDKPPSDTGLMDKGPAGKGWEETKPTKKQDYQVKEAIERALRENEAVREYVSYLEEQVDTAAKLVRRMQKEIHDVNLFNRKVMCVNEILRTYGSKLSREQKEMTIDRVDEAKSVREVQIVGNTLKKTFESLGKKPVVEGKRRPRPDAQRAVTRGGADPKVLQEQASGRKAGEYDQDYARIRQLAGVPDSNS